MKKPTKIAATAPATAGEQPQRGGSYLRDPETGALTLVEGPDAASADADQDAEQAPGTDANFNPGVAGDAAAPAHTDQEG